MLGNTFGRMFRVTTAGDSYGGGLAAIVDGVPPGIEVKEEYIQEELDKRRPGPGDIDAAGKESDQVEIFAGLRDGYTTGAPVGMIVHNGDTLPRDAEEYEDIRDLIRPGHADYTHRVKYDEYADWCDAGRAFERETVGRVAAGAVAKKILRSRGIKICSYVHRLGEIEGSTEGMTFDEIEQNSLKNAIFCPDPKIAEKMIEVIREAEEEGDTVGGVIEVLATGVPAGLGEPVFDTLSATISHGLMSIPGVTGIGIGKGFGLTRMKGSRAHDIPYVDEEEGRIRFRTNLSGGIHDGISNGEDILVKVGIKPTPPSSLSQPTVNMATMEEAELEPTTGCNPTICHRMCAVTSAMVRIAILDHLIMWIGYDGVSDVEHALSWW
ncbi:MAG: chorismate synthase [Armatimonadota bacterium]